MWNILQHFLKSSEQNIFGESIPDFSVHFANFSTTIQDMKKIFHIWSIVAYFINQFPKQCLIQNHETVFCKVQQSHRNAYLNKDWTFPVCYLNSCSLGSTIKKRKKSVLIIASQNFQEERNFGFYISAFEFKFIYKQICNHT